MKLSPLVALGLALILALLVVFVIDPLDKTTFSTPFCLGMILMWLSLRQKAWVVLTVTVLYCGLDFYATDSFLGSFRHPAEHPYFWFFQRFGLFLVVCVMSIYLSYHREESERNLKHIQGILSKLPAPVVISDAIGIITYANEALCSFFGKASGELVGKRYLELFMTNIDEGKAMRYYIELFGSHDQNAPEVVLLTSAGPTNIKASLTCLGTGTQRNMITVLQLPHTSAHLAKN
jgi:PAS domain S-box-containing protein